MRCAVAVVLCVSGLALGACTREPEPLDPAAVRLLVVQVEMARIALADGNPERSAALLDGVDDTVDRLRAEGRITDRRAAQVLAALGDVQDGVERLRGAGGAAPSQR